MVVVVLVLYCVGNECMIRVVETGSPVELIIEHCLNHYAYKASFLRSIVSLFLSVCLPLRMQGAVTRPD